MRRLAGVSLVEIMLGILLLGLLLVPLSLVMTQSSAQTVVSYHDQLAVQYVRELLDQVTELVRNDTGPGLDGLVRAGGKPLPELLEGLNPALSDAGPKGPRVVRVGGTQVGLLVSPLVSPFQARFFRVVPVEASGFSTSSAVRVFQVNAGVRWQPTGEREGASVRTYEATAFLVEEP